MINLKDGPLWQWSIGRQVVVTPKQGCTVDRVDFGSSMLDYALPGTLLKNEQENCYYVNIPDVFLQHAVNITVYSVMYDETGAKTTESVTFGVNPRIKPEDYIYTEEEVRQYEMYNKRLEYLEEHLDEFASADFPAYDDAVEKVKGLPTMQLEIDNAETLAQEAIAIAKGSNRARVFTTFEAMEAWLCAEANKGASITGDNLYIVDEDTPDYWISQVLNVADEETGYFYKIEVLETQKIDLTDINNHIAALNRALDVLRVVPYDTEYDVPKEVGYRGEHPVMRVRKKYQVSSGEPYVVQSITHGIPCSDIWFDMNQSKMIVPEDIMTGGYFTRIALSGPWGTTNIDTNKINIMQSFTDTAYELDVVIYYVDNSVG